VKDQDTFVELDREKVDAEVGSEVVRQQKDAIRLLRPEIKGQRCLEAADALETSCQDNDEART
jgi:hypothetical protein